MPTTASTADSLDTAVSVLGPQAGLALIEKTPGAAAFIVRAGEGVPETFESSRFASFETSGESNKLPAGSPPRE